MLPKPTLWTLRVLAVSIFVGVITWQVVRRQQAANPEPVGQADPKQEKEAQSTMFLSGSKSYTGATTVEGGTLVVPEGKRKAPTFIPSTKVGIQSHGEEITTEGLKDLDIDVDLGAAAKPAKQPTPPKVETDPGPDAFLGSSKSGELIAPEEVGRLETVPVSPSQPADRPKP